MKKLILILGLILCLPTLSSAKDVNLTLTDAVSAADTVITTQRFDTAYTPWAFIEGAQKIHFYAHLINDTNWAADSFWIAVEFSFNRVDPIKILELDTLVVSDSAWTGTDLLVADSIRGSYMRGRLIHYDSAEVKLPAVKDYKSRLKLYYSVQK